MVYGIDGMLHGPYRFSADFQGREKRSLAHTNWEATLNIKKWHLRRHKNGNEQMIYKEIHMGVGSKSEAIQEMRVKIWVSAKLRGTAFVGFFIVACSNRIELFPK